MDSTAVVLGLIAAGQALILGFVAYRQHRADKRVDEAKQRSDYLIQKEAQRVTDQGQKIDGHLRLIDQLQEQIDRERAARLADRELISRLEDEISGLRRKLVEYEIHNMRLLAELVKAGIDPPPSPASTRP